MTDRFKRIIQSWEGQLFTVTDARQIRVTDALYSAEGTQTDL